MRFCWKAYSDNSARLQDITLTQGPYKALLQLASVAREIVGKHTQCLINEALSHQFVLQEHTHTPVQKMQGLDLAPQLIQDQLTAPVLNLPTQFQVELCSGCNKEDATHK